MKRWFTIVAACFSSAAAAPAWEEGIGFRAAPLELPQAGRNGFARLAPSQTGVRFTNFVSDAQLAKNQILELGSGVALGDINRDGLIDIYLASMGGSNRLFRNLGNWKFQDVTTSQVACDGQFSTGALLADVDGDSDLDLLVNGIGHGTRLFANDGSGAFDERLDSGLVREHGSTSMALGDVDGDGALDLYVANYHSRTFKDAPAGLSVEAGYVGGQFVIKPPGLFLPLFLKTGRVSLFELGETDLIYRNDGTGKFAALSWTNGTFLDISGKPLTAPNKEWGLSAAFRDLNGDGAPDIYVCNDFFNSPDHVWINDGSGRFRAAPNTMLRHASMSSMAIDFADLNRDGLEDFMVLDMMSRDHNRRHRQRGSEVHLLVERPIADAAYVPEYPRNTVYLNRGDGTYAEIAQYSGLEASEWSWSLAFLDVDLDGYEDVLVTNGNLRDANDPDLPKAQYAGAKRSFPTLRTPNLAFRNRGDLTFEEAGGLWGFDHIGISHGMALGDLDNDGDLDVVINNMREAAAVYRNESIAPRVAVRTVGKPPNTQGIGAKIELLAGVVERQSQEVISGGRYLSGDDPMRTFAAGPAKSGMILKVTWRSGNESLLENVRANHLYEVDEAGATRPASTLKAPQQPFFEDVSARLRHPHQESDFNDFARQPTLSRQFSRLGPGLVWRDLDEDGWDDLVVGGSRNRHMVVYVNDRAGGFKPLRRQNPLQLDQAGLVTVRRAGGSLELLAASSNYEDSSKDTAAVIHYDLQRGSEADVVPSQPWAAGPVAIGFIDKQLALFVGARIKPGRYPEAGESLIYFRQEGAWKLDSTNSSVLASAGPVSAAAWADLNADGQVELILATDWGPIRIYRAENGKLAEVTAALGLNKYRGLWNGVATGDFDEDGRLDILASNWGRNTRYERHRAEPLRMYFGDWQRLGQIEILEAYYEPRLRHYVPFLPLDTLRNACPRLAERFPTFASYAGARVETITGIPEKSLSFLEANWFETTLFLNRGDHFEPRPLPPEAQFTPAFGVSIGDFDGDGHEDAFLSQNFFDVELETSRSDAGRGLWLRGDGRGNLSPVPGQESGAVLYGEQRGSAISDFDKDGRIDLAVGQNNGRIGLFRNVRGQPGIRVTLRGPAWNPDAVGSSIRLKYRDRFGPVRAIHLGSGYWSQEGVTQVMTGQSSAVAVSVRWPGGRVTEKPLNPGQLELSMAENE